MLRLATDIDVHGDVVRGLRHQCPTIDLVRVQDVLPERTPDPTVLAWAADESRVLLTNDRGTMVGFAYARLAAGEPIAGVIVLSRRQPIGDAIDNILLIAECMPAEEVRDRVVMYLPVRV